MKLWRLFLKILALPVVVVLTLLTWLCFGILRCTAWLFGLASIILAIIGAFAFFAVAPRDGIIWCVTAFLVSPFGIPMLSVHVVGGLYGLNDALKSFIRS